MKTKAGGGLESAIGRAATTRKAKGEEGERRNRNQRKLSQKNQKAFSHGRAVIDFSLRPSPSTFDESAHRAHDYRDLIDQWRKLARATGLRLQSFSQAGAHRCYYLQTPGAVESERTLYISAGIHGDEPAGPQALLRWAEQHLPTLSRHRPALPLLLFPCLNPWGLINNQRADAAGNDLNRIFDRHDVSPIGELKKLIAGRRFSLALALHEDYDARGLYIYEISPRPDQDLGKALLASAAGILPVDARKRIDGRPFDNGLKCQRDRAIRRIALHPESIYLYLHHTHHALTVETPSEFSLARRVEALVQLIDACAHRVENSLVTEANTPARRG